MLSRFALFLSLALNLTFAALSPAADPPQPMPDAPLAVKAVRAFPELKFNRPVLLTNAGDGSNRIFVAQQPGKIFVFPNKPDVEEADLFLDWEKKTIYKNEEFEEGVLGLAFHPKFKTNGEFFMYYTEVPHISVISRFKVSKSDPNKADPASEEQILRIPQPYWNHNGGTLCFGPDGFLYIGLGDGGAGNDPHKNGQNPKTMLGKILRIDVDHKDEGKKYAVPKDNPWVGEAGAATEAYAMGIRNTWRMSFDRKTGTLWQADVGQDLWEEINIITKGGNYGWNLREGLHKFKDGSDAKPELTEPIWEYHHTIGKSITGGVVYRGKKVPELDGLYLYGDFVTGKLWGLKYDEKGKKVAANYLLQGDNLPVMTYGEDESGEVYFTTPFGQIFTFANAQ
ncbi:MAG: PQQ-dependent sugar dehydrogenase [Planctomycetaceae bacterium]